MNNTGFGNNAANESSRLSNKDGSLQCPGDQDPHSGGDIHPSYPCTDANGPVHLTGCFYYLLVNTFFCTCIIFIGSIELTGISPGSGWLHEFLQAFFSARRRSLREGIRAGTPGYNLTNLLAALESFYGNPDICIDHGAYLWFFPTRAYRFSDHALIRHTGITGTDVQACVL